MDDTKREINKAFREADDSNLWPILGNFNATERAIKRAQKFQRESGVPLEGLEYSMFLEKEISQIVNSQS